MRGFGAFAVRGVFAMRNRESNEIFLFAIKR